MKTKIEKESTECTINILKWSNIYSTSLTEAELRDATKLFDIVRKFFNRNGLELSETQSEKLYSSSVYEVRTTDLVRTLN